MTICRGKGLSFSASGNMTRTRTSFHGDLISETRKEEERKQNKRAKLSQPDKRRQSLTATEFKQIGNDQREW